MENIEVKLSQSPYEISVGMQLQRSLAENIPQLIKGKRLLIISSPGIPTEKRQVIENTLHNHFEFLDTLLIPDGESYKSWDTVQSILAKLFEAHFERIDGILALGGGIIGDMAGFCAAIFKRGIPFIQYPSTLLAQVDAAIGGKTGINTPEGKNLIGSFYQPKKVFCDIALLDSLSKDEMQNGFAEIIKYAFIEQEHFYNFLQENIKLFTDLNSRQKPELWIQLIRKCAQCKASIVAKDERESNIRETLNFGHSIGHTIEKLFNYQIAHGQAVALGMLIETKLAVELNKCPQHLVDKLEKLLNAFEFRLRIQHTDIPSIIHSLSQDKKTQHQNTPILVPKEIGNFQKIILPPPKELHPLLEKIIKEINSEY